MKVRVFLDDGGMVKIDDVEAGALTGLVNELADEATQIVQFDLDDGDVYVMRSHITRVVVEDD